MTEIRLYHEAIVSRARSALGAGRLDAPHGSHTVDNPLCGDRVTMDVVVESGNVSGVGHVVRGCLLCEAAASVIAEEAIGETLDDLRAISRGVQSMLDSDSPLETEWDGLEMFRPVANYRSRHLCVLLAFQALIGALEYAYQD